MISIIKKLVIEISNNKDILLIKIIEILVVLNNEKIINEQK